jgi:hypothetical protein
MKVSGMLIFHSLEEEKFVRLNLSLKRKERIVIRHSPRYQRVIEHAYPKYSTNFAVAV